MAKEQLSLLEDGHLKAANKEVKTLSYCSIFVLTIAFMFYDGR